MSISSRFAVGIHILALLELNKDMQATSDYIAKSVNTNPALIRKITGMLKKAGLVDVKPGVAGAKLAKHIDHISLLDVYQAVDVVQDNELFSVHPKPNPQCPIGRNFQNTIIPIFNNAQRTMEKALDAVTLGDVISDLLKDEKLT